jgi:MOSC domain-containing protein YiiM
MGNDGHSCTKINGTIKENETAKALAEDLGIDNPLMVSDQGPAPQEGDIGIVKSVNTSPKKGMRKSPAASGVIQLAADYGVTDDAHAGDWHRQVSFLAEESIQVARDHGLDVGYGDFAENITTSGINVKGMPLGTLLRVGTATVEVSQIGKICHTRCAIYYLAGDCIFPREGIFGWVVEPGEVRVGDEVRILKLGDGEVHRTLSDKPL